MYALNDLLWMKKPHPCGGKEWQVVALGADVKLQCKTCGRYITLSRIELAKREKRTK